MPKSASDIRVNLLALIASSVVLYLLIAFTELPNDRVLQIVAFVLFVPMAISEFLNSPRIKQPVKRVGRITEIFPRSIGVLISVGSVAFVYWLLPEYSGTFYDPFYKLCHDYGKFLVIALPFYIGFVVKYIDDSKDGYYSLGMAVLGDRSYLDADQLKHHFLGWAVKGFFYPLMYIYALGKIEWIKSISIDFDTATFLEFFDIAIGLLYYVDLIFVVVAYLCTLKLFGAHIRTAQTTLLGWSVALACYQPFWSFVSSYYVKYGNGLVWHQWLSDQPALIYLWGFVIIALTAVYTMATVAFGLRFSNLTNRGIITSGPYRYMKHPAYFCKNLSWWFISVPFVVVSDWEQAIKCCLALLMLNGIYYLRAKTEEKHLSTDFTYVRYSLEIRSRWKAANWRQPIAANQRAI
ncbi:isoprenylcysteine carboxylmethyltransferase family protein [Pseudoteredinibacter isoporae]|uniref:Protein-S-isoprenylcysteine O-methyltransferase Ste14 n=1 Tax=Pseudoteredinibacter isoporae TaxID=570281 RepID=A0A7X0MZ83_9GAMM|nr:isoprenylcysteine carboxylmethyltransferase family protein [Pseudoteredinibacter isoporae]MBB6523894.1 protein-S-isoprenylcysteine O-methyltransferase Ste14 [Pseudoteredinibacter isoporae]NHO89394.1 isoprenylcysteine carboxyl methyltransferase [Pseudoteredinibacter isoporae]NIB22784.1 isoprenylcysteine carboxyl methyltransferase [Pseudoteredinibacter isoporae]